YVVEEFEPEVRALFRRVDPGEHWNEAYDLTQFPTHLEFLASPEASTRTSQLLAGEVDLITGVIPEDMDRINNGSGVSVEAFPTDRTMMLMMRNDVAPFDSVEFRKAMNYATDASVIIETVLSGFGQQTAQVTPPSWNGDNPDLMATGDENPYPFDLDRAEQLVEESGYAGAELELVGPNGRYMKDVEVLQALAGQISQLPNVDVEATALDQSTWRDQISPELEAKPAFGFFGFGSSPPDAAVKIGRNLTCGRRNSDFSTFCDERLDAMYDEAQAATEAEERRQILEEANRFLVEDLAACVPLYFQSHLYGVSERISFTGIPQEEVYWYAVTRP
ncbi:MAG: ABC transporter substrate-binding protein, partial [Halobacteriales archaeon]|nr:ABC transporter substrate-binding protein [Halobacteriales archaeon]